MLIAEAGQFDVDRIHQASTSKLIIQHTDLPSEVGFRQLSLLKLCHRPQLTFAPTSTPVAYLPISSIHRAPKVINYTFRLRDGDSTIAARRMYRPTGQIPPRSLRRLVAAHASPRLGKVFQLVSQLALEVVEKCLVVTNS